MKTNLSIQASEDAYLKSGFFEQLVEHAFISEVLQEVYYGTGQVVEVLRAEVDASGYDLVMECRGILRHIQLKTSRVGGRTASQKVNVALGRKLSGCVVWVIREEDSEEKRMKLSYRVFSDAPGKPLPSLENYKTAKHTKGDASGKKAERAAIRVVPKRAFQVVATTSELVKVLFGEVE